MIDLGTIGALAVKIGGDASDLKAALNEANASLSKTDGAMRATVNAAGKLVVAMAATGVAMVAALVTKTMMSVDAQAMLARQLNGTIAGLNTMNRAAALANVEQEKMAMAAKRLQVAIGTELQGGTKELSAAFTKLGLSAEELSRMDIDERIGAINKALLENVPAAERAAVAGELFGNRMGAAIASISAEDLRVAKEEVKALGLAVSAIDAETIDRAGDSLSTIGEVARGVGNRITVELAPVIDAIATKIRNTAVESEGFKEAVSEALTIAFTIAGKVADAFHGLHVVFKGLQAAVLSLDGFIMRMIANILSGISKVLMQTEPAWVKTYREMADSVSETAKTARGELEMLANKPLPSEGLKAFLEEAKRTADEISKAAVKARKRETEGGPAGKGKDTSEEDNKRLEVLRAALRTEEEAQQESHRKQLSELAEFKGKKLISEVEFNALVLKENAKHEAAMAELANKKIEVAVKEQEARDSALEDLRESLLSEEALQWESYERKLLMMKEAETLGMKTKEELDAMKEALEQQHMDRLVAIRNKGLTDIEKFTLLSYNKQAQTITGMMEQMTAGVSRESRAAFNINKLAGAANVALKIPEAMANSYAFGSKFGGPVLGGVMAGIAGAAMLLQLRAIARTSFDGGGSAAPSLSGGTAAPPVSPVGGTGEGQGAGGGQTNIYHLHGEVFSRKAVRGLLEQQNENARDGGRSIFV